MRIESASNEPLGHSELLLCVRENDPAQSALHLVPTRALLHLQMPMQTRATEFDATQSQNARHGTSCGAVQMMRLVWWNLQARWREFALWCRDVRGEIHPVITQKRAQWASRTPRRDSRVRLLRFQARLDADRKRVDA